MCARPPLASPDTPRSTEASRSLGPRKTCDVIRFAPRATSAPCSSRRRRVPCCAGHDARGGDRTMVHTGLALSALAPELAASEVAFAMALLVGTTVAGTYGPGDARRHIGRLCLAAAIASALPLWSRVWSQSPLDALQTGLLVFAPVCDRACRSAHHVRCNRSALVRPVGGAHTSTRDPRWHCQRLSRQAKGNIPRSRGKVRCARVHR